MYAGFWTVMLSQYAADDILVDLEVEDQRNLLRDPPAAEAGVTPFDLNDCRNEFRSGTSGSGFSATLGCKQEPVFSLH
jgi:hypothetical protein